QFARTSGVEQALIFTSAGLTSLDPADGHVIWRHDWPLEMACVAQPAIVAESDLLFGNQKDGVRRIHLTHNEKSWAEEKVWESGAFKPYYNDLFVHKDHIYGFDGNFFTCVNLADGKGRWRARGYGNGQALLLADQGLLLILSEQGEVALVEANPEHHH